MGLGAFFSRSVKSLVAYEGSYSRNSVVFSLLTLAFHVVILFGSLQRQSKPICLTGTTFLITAPSDRGNKTHVSCRVWCLN